jgi:hypothetical protein
MVSFHFKNWIRPGIYSVTLESDGEIGNEVTPYVALDQNKQSWIIPFQGKLSVCFWDYYDSLFQRSWFLAVIFGVIVFSLASMAVSRISILKKVVATYVSALLLTNIATPPYSGYDETAHISMYFEALKLEGLANVSNNEFYHLVWKDMSEFDFFRLHSIPPKISSECPHSILGHCGLSSKPIKLYTIYAKVLHFFNVEQERPWVITIGVRLINITLILCMLLLGVAVLKKPQMVVFTLSLTFLGGMLSQAASLTNDIPLFLLGCVALQGFVIALNRNIYWKLASIIIVFVLTFLLWEIDVSSITALPLLSGIIILSFTPKISPLKPKNITDRTNQNLLTRFFIFILIVLLMLITFRALMNLPLISDRISKLANKLYLLNDFKLVDYSNFSGILVSYWKSFVGTYVWGHSYWPQLYYLIGFIAYLITFLKGLKQLGFDLLREKYFFVLFIIAAIVSVQLIVIFSIAAGSVSLSDQIAREAYTKVRLSAPLSTGILIMPMFWHSSIEQYLDDRGFFVKLWLVLFGLFHSLWLPTKFFFADLF